MKQKILLILTLLYSVVTMVFAGPISEAEAQQKASEFISGRNAKTAPVQSKAIMSDDIMFTTAEVCDAFYVFNNETSGGYVIVSSDDRMPAVLGYSYSGTYDPNEIPDNMRSWLNGYVEQYEYMLQHDDVTAISTTSVTGDKIYPLLTSKWDQSYPYNALCPQIDGKSTYTGCVATAMAQIMYYHQWPKKTIQAIPGYTTYTNKIEMPEIGITSINWDNMLPTYSYRGNYSAEQENAISTLFLMCGASIEMDYDKSGSGASTFAAMRAFGKYFDYPDYKMSYAMQRDYQQSEWNQMIYDEIKNERPVLYGGYSSSSGHAFIIDGYDKEDYFHVNWGWGGYEDDYFLLNSLNGYNSGQDAIIGIESPETADGVKYAYATYKDNTLTFHYDNNRDERQGILYTSLRSVYDDERHMYIMDWYEYAPYITSVIFDESFSECKVTSTDHWFKDMNKLNNLDFSNFNTQNVTRMVEMFNGCSSLRNIDLNGFDTQNVKRMSYMFYNCISLKSMDLNSFNTQNVIDMSWMFAGCSSLTSLDLSGFNTEKVTDMYSMFNGCRSLTSINFGNINTQNVKDMGFMFRNCGSLKGIDLSIFSTQNVTDMRNMFSECSSLTTLDLSGFNTQNVTNMDYMFSSCSKLTSLDLSNFHTENVTDMSGMFIACQNLKSLDLSNFNVKKTTEMDYMFYNCDNLKTINVSEKWDTSNVIKSTRMFMFCSNLVGQDGTTYNSSYTDVSKAHYGTGGYLTYKASSAIDAVNLDTNNILSRKFYSTDGKQFSSPRKGLNILKLNDGTTKKLIK